GSHSAAGDGNHRARDPEDIRLFPRQRGRRAHREDLSGGRIGPGSWAGRSLASGVLDAGGAVQSFPEGDSSSGWSGGAVGGTERRAIGRRRGFGPEEL